MNTKDRLYLSVADPGFPRGIERLGWGADLRHGHFSAKTYAKTKELDPVGGGGGGGTGGDPLDPPMLMGLVSMCFFSKEL